MIPQLARSFVRTSNSTVHRRRLFGLAAGGTIVSLAVVGSSGSLADSDASPPSSSWDKAVGLWESAKKAFGSGSWWISSTVTNGPVALPTDKLRCSAQPYSSSQNGGSPIGYRPVVLVACGSFNPPTIAHLRMMELARDAMTAKGYDILGGYLSPVSDAYWKQALAPGPDRVAMARAAVEGSDFLMVDAWEAAQPRYTRTVVILERVAYELRRPFDGGDAVHPNGISSPDQGAALPRSSSPVLPRSVLVCGADVLESMADPALWRQDLLDKLLRDHGLVCISRGAVETAELLERPGTPLHAHRSNITIVQEPVPNEISSSLVRQELANGKSVKYLVPEQALQYIYERGLYGTAGPVAQSGTALHSRVH